MRSPKKLLVFANPYHAGLDHNERPCCAVSVPHDGVSQYYDRRWVGASPEKDADGEQYFVFEQYEANGGLKADAQPVTLESGVSARAARFRQAIKSGELLAADVDTYKAVFGTTEGYLPASEIVAKEMAESRTRHLLHGRGEPDPKPHTVWTEPLSPEGAAAAAAQKAAEEITAKQTPRARAKVPDAPSAPTSTPSTSGGT